MKGQVALEYLMITGIVIAVAVSVFVFALLYSTDSVASLEAQDAVNSIAKTADTAYAMGKGGFLTTTVSIPSNVISSEVNENIVKLTIRTTGGVSDVVGISKSTLNGSVPSIGGVYKISVNMTSPNVTLGQVQA